MNLILAAPIWDASPPYSTKELTIVFIVFGIVVLFLRLVRE
jgi:hypothetical protein